MPAPDPITADFPQPLPVAQGRPAATSGSGRLVRRLCGSGKSWVGWAVMMVWCSSVLAVPFRPTSDDQVLESVARTLSSQTKGVLRKPRVSTLTETLARARDYLREGQTTFDPRYAAYAENLLQPWRKEGERSAPYWTLLATVHQSRHEFARALEELDQALKLDPAYAQAWLTRTIVLQVLGRYDEARQSCMRMNGLVSPLVLTATAANLASLTGRGDEAVTALQALMERSLPNADPAEAIWAHTILGEMAARLGRTALAEAGFKAALQIAPDDAYAMGAFADLLLRRGACKEALALVSGREQVDGLFLRKVIAEKRIGARTARPDADRLGERLRTSLELNPTAHLREYARFLLEVRGDATAAFQASLENWKIQREPADREILQASALAAKKAVRIPELSSSVEPAATEEAGNTRKMK